MTLVLLTFSVTDNSIDNESQGSGATDDGSDVGVVGWDDTESEEEETQPTFRETGSRQLSPEGWESQRSPTPEIIGRGSRLYDDDDLGLNATRAQRPAWPAVELEDSEEVVPPPPSSGGPPDGSSNRLPGNQFFIFVEVLRLLAPPIDLMPCGPFWAPGGVGHDAIVNLTNVGRVCSLWHDTSRSLGSIWGAFVPAARDEQVFRLALERAGDAPVRLAYRVSIPKATVDAEIHRASAIYAGVDCPWRNFARILQRRLPNLRVLIILPDTTDMPLSVLRSYAEHLDAPLLIICETSSPLLFIAPRLQRLRLKFYTLAQLRRTLSSLASVSLQRLVIEDIHEVERVDFTALLTEVKTDRIDFLRINAAETLASGLVIEGPRISCPEIKTIDLSGPAWLSAPHAEDAKLFNVDVDELLCVLAGIPLIETLHTRGRAEWDTEPRVKVHAAHHVQLPVQLNRAHTIVLSGVMCEETVTLLQGIRAPLLTYLEMFCDMPAPPIHDLVSTSRERVATALVAAQSHPAPNVTQLMHSLAEIDIVLRNGGHRAICQSLRAIPGFPSSLGPRVQAVEPDWQTASGMAESLMQVLDEAVADGPIAHNGFLLRAVVDAAREAIRADEPEMPPPAATELRIRVSRKGVNFVATVGARSCALKFAMAASRSNEWSYSHHLAGWSLSASTTFGVACMLFGLELLKPRVLSFQDDPLHHDVDTVGTNDGDTLREVLRRYDETMELRVDPTYRGWTHKQRFLLLDVLSDPTTLPRLKSMTAVCAIQQGDDQYAMARYLGQEDNGHEDVLDAVLDMLSARTRGGARLERITLEGSFCLREAYRRRLEELVPQVLPSVMCCHPAGALACDMCRGMM
ncbi:unnamed protein product [Peniophora sp. CBMAI 1063]|nr:unnamed protein product [Peniophora sp. CBMAI 1063]